MELASREYTASPFHVKLISYYCQYAAFYFRPELCDWLLRLGVDPERVDKKGRFVNFSASQSPEY